MFSFPFFKRAAPAAPAAAASRPPAPVSATQAATVRQARPQFRATPKYPPADPGLPACEVEGIVESQADLMRRLRRAVSCDDETFEQRYVQPIRNLARYIHLLPASAHDHFAGPGGLFRLCCEIGFFAAQAADERIYTPTADVEARHALEPRWKYGTFLAGLICEIHRPLAAAVVTTEAGEQWPKFLTPLDSWIAEKGLQNYFVSWQAGSRAALSGAEGSAIMGAILPKDELTWLDQGSPTIVRDLFSVALGQARAGESILADVVDGIRQKVLKNDELTRRSRYGHLRCGHHLELHLLDSIREHIARADWKVHNGKDGPIWYGSDGLYIEWPRSCANLLADLERNGLRGLPRNPMTIAETLGNAGLLVSADSGQWTWPIIVSDPAAPGEPERRTALRVRDAGAVLGFVEAKNKDRPFAEYLVERTGGPAVAGSPADQAVAQSYQLAESPEVAAALAPEAASAPVASAPAKGGTEAKPRAAPAAPAPAPAPADAGSGAPSPAPASAATTRARPAPAQDPADGLNFGVAPGGRGAPPAEARVGGQAKASPASHVPEALRKTLKDAEAEMIGRWIERYRARRVEAVIELPGQAIAVSQDTLTDDDLELGAVVTTFDKRNWLGAIPGEARGMRAGSIAFGDKKKIGFVINAAAAKSLGFFAS